MKLISSIITIFTPEKFWKWPIDTYPWIPVPGKVQLKSYNRSSRYDPLVEEVENIDDYLA